MYYVRFGATAVRATGHRMSFLCGELRGCSGSPPALRPFFPGEKKTTKKRNFFGRFPVWRDRNRDKIWMKEPTPTTTGPPVTPSHRRDTIIRGGGVVVFAPPVPGMPAQLYWTPKRIIKKFLKKYYGWYNSIGVSIIALLSLFFLYFVPQLRRHRVISSPRTHN